MQADAGSYGEHGCSHDSKARDEDRAAAPPVDKRDGNEGREDVRDADDYRRPHLRVVRAEPGHLHDLRAEVHDDVDAGQLLHELQRDAEEHDLPEVGVGPEEAEAVMLYLQGILDVRDLGPDLVNAGPDLLQHLDCLVVLALRDEPLGRARDKVHAYEENDSGNDGNAEHPAP